MKRFPFLLIGLILFSCPLLHSQKKPNPTIGSPQNESVERLDFPFLVERYQYLKPSFSEAYKAFPSIPKGMLEAVAWANTHMRNTDPTQINPSCLGIPAVYGVMGISSPIADNSPRENILAFASSLVKINQKTKAENQDINYWFSALSLMIDPDAPGGFPVQSHLYSIARFMNDPGFRLITNSDGPFLSLESVFGPENLRVLSSGWVKMSPDGIISNDGARFSEDGSDGFSPQKLTQTQSPDYPAGVWDPTTCNFSSRSGTPISAVTIHTMQGTYAGAISWFKNCNSNVSAHYCIRSWDGQVTQMVLESDKAWHVGTENPYTIGIEHEGFVEDASWYTSEMYNSSAALVSDIVASGYGINPLKTYAGPPTQGGLVLPQNCYRIKGHQHFPNQTHVDPGPNWDWDRYYRLINGPVSPTVFTACNGNFYDTGGAGANYSDQERSSWTLAPVSGNPVTLNFSAFDLENNFDYLYVYDGASAEGEFLGSFTGTSLPPALTGQSGALFIEFRSDCFSNRPGWVASWACSPSPAVCGSPDGLSSTPGPFGAVLNWNAIPGATSYELRYRHSLETNWIIEQITSNSYNITGLASTSLYYWQVKTICGVSSSGWAGATFTTPTNQNVVTTDCEGNFRDAGGLIGHYRNAENYTFTIQPPGADGVTLNFTSFETENNYDFLYVYDGPGIGAPLIGTYSGTNGPGTISSTGGAITFRFVSDNNSTAEGWEATWQCISNQAPFTAIGPVNNWYSDDFISNYTDTDNGGGGIFQRFYQVLEWDGAIWTTNRDNGFLYEDFNNGTLAQWSQVSGNAYLLNDRMHQTDTLNPNTNMFIDVGQGAGNAYLYTFSGRVWAGLPDKNRRFGLHFFVDDPNLSNRGNSYLVWFSADNQNAIIYETVNDALFTRATIPVTISDYVWYDFKITYDPVTGVIDVFMENSLILSWTDPTPLTVGSHISFRTNEAHCDFENMQVFKSRGANQNILIGPASTEDCRYMSPNPTKNVGRILTQIRDGFDHWSNIDFKSFKVDWTPPSDPSPVEDGLGTDIDTVFQTSSLSANWAVANDTESGVVDYAFALGTTPGGIDVQNWTNAGLQLFATQNGLSLIHNQMYYVSVRAQNEAGLFSNVISSDGQLVWSPPLGLTNDPLSKVSLFPNPFKDELIMDFSELMGKNLPEKVILTDYLGKELMKLPVSGKNLIHLNTQHLPSGIYLLQLVKQSGTIISRKVLKTE